MFEAVPHSRYACHSNIDKRNTWCYIYDEMIVCEYIWMLQYEFSISEESNPIDLIATK